MEEWGWFDSESSKGGVGEEVRNGNAENREERERESGQFGQRTCGQFGQRGGKECEQTVLILARKFFTFSIKEFVFFYYIFTPL